MSGTDDCGNISTDFFGELSVLFRCRYVVAVVWMLELMLVSDLFSVFGVKHEKMVMVQEILMKG